MPRLTLLWLVAAAALMDMASCQSDSDYFCLSRNERLNAGFNKDLWNEVAISGYRGDFSDYRGGESRSEYDRNECCMWDVCGLSCPVDIDPPAAGFGTVVAISIVLSFLVGVAAYCMIPRSTSNFFVGSRSLPPVVVMSTLAAQALDSNAILGNVELSYRYAFYDGAVIPIGLSISLFLNGVFLAEKIHKENLLTLPDLMAKRYGPVVEVLVSCASLISFMMLLAGNLAGMGVICGYLWGFSDSGAIWIATAIVWAYTTSGGLYSVAYTDILQASTGLLGCFVLACWFMVSEDHPSAAPPSIGFPGYIYPDNVGEDGVCDMYEGVPCQFHPESCCYNEALWCPLGTPFCDRYDRGAYPLGDKAVYPNQMMDPLALSPHPNALIWNWSTIFILAFGNLGALDFQARCMASKSAKTARLGCIAAAAIVLMVGIPMSFLGAQIRIYYGPDSIHGEFEPDSCHIALGLPSCGRWLPDNVAFPHLLTNQAPPFLGAWCLVGIVAASMSTADGAILALGTVTSNNLFYHFKSIKRESLLFNARVTTLPLALVSTAIAAYYQSSHSAGATGYLLIFAFDVMLATSVVPLIGALYVKDPSPRAALLSVLGGAACRIFLELALVKDGSLVFTAADHSEYLNFGQAASLKTPSFVDTNTTDTWDPAVEPCDQAPYRDMTGMDSLASFAVAILLFVSVQFYEERTGKPLFVVPFGEGYQKHDKTKDLLNSDSEKVVEVMFLSLVMMFALFTILFVIVVNS